MLRKELSLYLRIEQDLLVNGDNNLDMVMEHKFGLMELNMKVTGRTTRLTDMVFSGMYMVINTKDNGKEIKPTDLENILTVMVLHMKETGVMICNTVMV